MSTRPFVILFDLDVLVEREPGAPSKARPEAGRLLSLGRQHRLGVVACGHPGFHADDLARLLGALGLAEGIDLGLLVVDGGGPDVAPGPEVFGRAAEQAGVPVDQCVFVSADPLRMIVAEGVGLRSVSLPSGGPAEPARAEPPPLDSHAQLDDDATDEADEASETSDPGELSETSETVEVGADAGRRLDLRAGFVLQGRVVTMTGQGNDQGEVLDDGRVWVHQGRIGAVVPAGQPLPPSAREAPVLETKGTIYPGLVDLHNHFVYNVLPLWVVPKRYTNRTQWPRHADYRPQISRPVKALAGFPATARALVRYVEAKAIIGGTTTGQGIRTRVSGGIRQFEGAMRNVEVPDLDELPAAGTRVPDLNARSDEAIESFRSNLDARRAYFYHLSEGNDDAARARLLDLVEHELVGESLVGIHALGLHAEDYDRLAEAGAKIVWSPFSNLLLYGQTLDLATVLASGVRFSLGCDWSPTGGKNLLQELKVARHEARRQGVSLDAGRLVAAVTRDAARVASWHEQLGSLRAGALADLLVVYGATGDPYEHLVDAREVAVDLVVVGGVARYGEPRLVRPLHGGDAVLERWTTGGRAKLLALQDEGSLLADLGLADAQEVLTNAMDDLPAFVEEQARAREAGLLADGAEPSFEVEVDNELDDHDEVFEAMLRGGGGLLADDDPGIGPQIPLDGPEVGTGDYWTRVEGQANLSESLQQQLRKVYPDAR